MPAGWSLAGFLGNMITRVIAYRMERKAYYQGRLSRRTYLPRSTPTLFNGLFRQPAALPLFRHRVAPAGSAGMLTGSAIGLAIRLALGPD